MKTVAALLMKNGLPMPYAKSKPFELVEIDLEKPHEGEVLLRITGAGICHSDLSIVNGSRPRPIPLIGGHEGVGVVEELGAGIKDLNVGDTVSIIFMPPCGECRQCLHGIPAYCSVGSAANVRGEMSRGGSRISFNGKPIHHYNGVSCYSQHMVLDRRSLVKIPSDLPLSSTAIFGCALLTGIGAVRNGAKVPSGASVGIWGLGGVGLAALIGAVISKASPIIAIDPVAMKRELALELGADIAIAPTDDVREYVKDGVDYSIETVGRVEALQQAYEMTIRGGVVTTIGLPDPSALLGIPAASLVTEVKTLQGSYMGSGDPRKDIPEFVQFWREGKLPVEKLVSLTRPMSEVNEAMDALHGGEVVRQVILP